MTRHLDHPHLRLVTSTPQREPIVLPAEGYADEQLLIEMLLTQIPPIG